MLQNPGSESARLFYKCVTNFRDWGISIREAVNAFAEDSERSWMLGRPALGNW